MDCEDKFLLDCMIMVPKKTVSFNCVAIRQTMQATAKQQERCLLSTAFRQWSWLISILKEDFSTTFIDSSWSNIWKAKVQEQHTWNYCCSHEPTQVFRVFSCRAVRKKVFLSKYVKLTCWKSNGREASGNIVEPADYISHRITGHPSFALCQYLVNGLLLFIPLKWGNICSKVHSFYLKP